MALPITPPSAETRPYCLDLSDKKTLSLDSQGQLVRDFTVASRARMRLTAKRGQWPYDPNLGSRFHQLTTRELRTKALGVAIEALQPLIDEGAITDVAIGAISINETTGACALEVTITVPRSSQGISIGVPVGDAP